MNKYIKIKKGVGGIGNRKEKFLGNKTKHNEI